MTATPGRWPFSQGGTERYLGGAGAEQQPQARAERESLEAELAAEEVQGLVSLMIRATDGIPFPSRMNSM